MGRPDVDRMLSEIDSHTFSEWMAFYNVEPWGEINFEVLESFFKTHQKLEDYRIAGIKKMLADRWRDPDTHPRPFDITDFVPMTKEEREEHNLKKMEANLKGWLLSVGAKKHGG